MHWFIPFLSPHYCTSSKLTTYATYAPNRFIFPMNHGNPNTIRRSRRNLSRRKSFPVNWRWGKAVRTHFTSLNQQRGRSHCLLHYGGKGALVYTVELTPCRLLVDEWTWGGCRPLGYWTLHNKPAFIRLLLLLLLQLRHSLLLVVITVGIFADGDETNSLKSQRSTTDGMRSNRVLLYVTVYKAFFVLVASRNFFFLSNNKPCVGYSIEVVHPI